MLETPRTIRTRPLHAVRNSGPGQQGTAATMPCGTSTFHTTRRVDGRRPPVAVAVLAGDTITAKGTAAFLSTCEGIRVVPGERRHEAEVVLILVRRVTDETLGWMRGAAEAADGRDVRFVLVSDGITERQVLRAVTYGLVSVVPSQHADFDRVLHTIAAVREGRVDLPDLAQGWLANRIRTTQQLVLEPNGLTATGLEQREVDVLRLLAQGLGTRQMARDLNYSERTVKNIIHGMLTRLNLLNRTHAVAFALHHGVL